MTVSCGSSIVVRCFFFHCRFFFRFNSHYNNVLVVGS